MLIIFFHLTGLKKLIKYLQFLDHLVILSAQLDLPDDPCIQALVTVTPLVKSTGVEKIPTGMAITLTSKG